MLLQKSGGLEGILRAFKAHRRSTLGLLVQNLELEGKFEICVSLEQGQ